MSKHMTHGDVTVLESLLVVTTTAVSLSGYGYGRLAANSGCAHRLN